MAFNSVQYALFLILVVVVYRTLRRRGQNVLLLVASYVFYAAWDWRFLSLLLISTATDFLVGRAMGRSTDDFRRRRLLAISMTVNLGLLAGFKYFNFFVESAAGLLNAAGLEADWVTLTVILPVGISFYTFQTMSYTIDVYRRKVEPTQDLLGFAVFVAFFPQLVAGPIERARRLLPQFAVRRSVARGDHLWSALHLIGLGLFKKVVIADAVAPHVNSAFAAAGSAGWLTLLVGLVGFSLQIYGDFSGYSNIARGSARLLGIELMVNFNQPYLARNISHFWRCWHISFSTWLRDYLYIPLGGNRGSEVTVYRNLMITMLLGGLWHGAAWTFVVWGALHGLLLALHRRFRSRTAGSELDPPTLRTLPSVLVTFTGVTLTWIFFRAATFGEAWDYLGGLMTLRPGAVSASAVWTVVPALLVTIVIDLAQRRAGMHEAIGRWPAVARGLAYGAGVTTFIVFSGNAPVPFLYFQF
jgi:D-alanyl-lipoteichoic acid acyltransferase DltB (MBOAT superfamily)